MAYKYYSFDFIKYNTCLTALLYYIKKFIYDLTFCEG